MNTAKQINMMIGLLFVGLFGTFLYFLFDNGFSFAGMEFDGREDIAVERQEITNVERGAFLYARNCRSCHGQTGQGPIERGGLPGLPLNLPDNRPPTLTDTELNPLRARFTSTIHCGRVGTQMPPWSTAEGGPLNDFQIYQLVTLITSRFAPEGWEFAVEEANHADAFAPAKHLEEALGTDDDVLVLNSVEGLLEDTTLRIGGDTIEEPYEVMTIDSIDEDANEVSVTRDDPLEHEAGAEVYNGPIAPPGTITGADGVPPCGQKAAAASPGPGGDGGEAVELTDGAEITMGDNFFELDGAQNPTFSVAAGAAIEVVLTNGGSAVHNMRITGDDGEFDTDDDLVSDPDLMPAGSDGTIAIELAAAGDYDYRCDFHPTDMVGTITAQ